MERGILNSNAQIHFWDMDHTLIDNDCDVSWKRFMVDTGRAPATDLPLIDMFYKQYEDGCLDVPAFNAFQLREFVGHSYEEMAAVAQDHFHQVVQGKLYPEAEKLVRELRARDAQQCLLTATNRIVAEPLAAYLGLAGVLATELEIVDGKFTGRFAGTYCMGDGKVGALQAYSAERGVAIADVAYYGDSVADIPVLQAVGHPRAVNPAPALRAAAEAGGWPILAFERLS